MNFKNRTKVASLLAVVALLGSCKGKTEVPKPSGDTWSGTLKEGYTSLANNEANPEVVDGKYSVAGQTFTTKNTYNSYFQTEPTSYNYLSTQWQYNALHFVQMVDGLISNNQYGTTYGGLALGYKTVENADGTETWTFQLKEGVQWINNKDGKVYAEVTADDFVCALEWVLDPNNGSNFAYLPTGVIKNADAYYQAKAASQKDTTQKAMDFSEVGVKAVDKYTLEYTLVEPTPYFLTCLTYSVYYPVNRAWLQEQGSEFGKTQDNILVNGAFRLTNHVASSLSEFERNYWYYDREHVYFDNVKLTFIGANSGVEQSRLLYENGTIDQFTVQSSDTVGYKKYVTGEDGTGTPNDPYDPTCSATSSTDQFSFIGYFNYNRSNYHTGSDNKTDAQKAATQAAVENKNFRKGFLYGLNVLANLKFYNQTDPVQRLNRVYTVKGLAQDSDGKDYVDYVQDVYNEKQGTTDVKLVGTDISESGSAEDPIYSPTKAKAYFATAKAELAAAGITAEHIIIDVIGDMEATAYTYQKEMYDAITTNSEGWVQIRMFQPSSTDEKTKWAEEENNYDFSMEMGWGADYGDPKSFLHTVVGATYDDNGTCIDIGDNLYLYGFSGEASEKALSDKIFGNYTALYNKALQYNTTDTYKQRLQAFAEAEYDAIYEDCLFIPWYTRSGIYDVVGKVVPHQASSANYGNNSDKFANIVVSDNAITKEQRNAINANYNSHK